MGFLRPNPKFLNDGHKADSLPRRHFLIQLELTFIDFLVPDIMPGQHLEADQFIVLAASYVNP